MQSMSLQLLDIIVPSTLPQGVAVPDDTSTFPRLSRSMSFHRTDNTLALCRRSDHLPHHPC